MSSKTVKSIKTIAIIILTMALICSFFVSQNTHHIEHCKDQDCEICNIIHFAQIIVNLIVTMFICVITSYLIKYIISKIQKTWQEKSSETLVFRKVQMNE